MRAVRWRGGGADISVIAVSDEVARTVLEQATQDAVEPPAPEDETVEIGFWNLTQHGPRRRSRQIEAPPWAEIRTNYTGAAATAIDTLVGGDPDLAAGPPAAVHGPPGTGKTTALRALAREWRAWCQLDFVLDPERLFAEPGYLIEVRHGPGRRRRSRGGCCCSRTATS